MFIRQTLYYCIYGIILSSVFSVVHAQADSSNHLRKVIVTGYKKPLDFTTAVPVQSINHETLQQINAETIADAAKYFSGVLIKDYGGIGGLKTISVRSLGALNTGLIYDGIPVADAQTGQIDLSKFSSTFVQSLELAEANPQQILLPARAYSSASVLAVTTNTFNTTNFTKTNWKGGIKQGSFGLWQPFAGVYLPTGKHIVISANAEAIWAKGNYPYYIENGTFSQKANRSNSDIKSFQGEVNIVKQFSDSSQWQTKIWGYTSERGLPGSIIFFNNTSAQRLWDKDFFAQSHYQKKISAYTSLLVAAKYSSLFTRYKDPNFLNNAGGLDDRYTQQEIYASAALNQKIGKYFSASLASDFSSAYLTSNVTPFATPTRNTWWNNLAVQYARPKLQINASLLSTIVHDKTKTGTAASDKNELTPTVAASYKTSAESPFLFRAFYKNIFRLPTFNDLYYTYNSNVNPKLQPEYSKQYNAGITYSKNFNATIQQLSISADAYYNTVKNKIIGVPSQNLFVWTMMNISKVHIKGVDMNANASGTFSSSLKWSLRIAYTWQQALDITDPSSSQYKNEIPYTPDNSGSALAAIHYQQWSAGYSFLFSGKRYALGENDPSNEVDGWSTHDLFVARAFNLTYFQTTVKAELNNVFNERYDVIRYYPMPGRSYKITITLNNL
ncbi:MAG TPA: TonB-dependent receptor [Puia sp.]|nr:TonB-dependent receptor [Puia sp.]